MYIEVRLERSTFLRWGNNTADESLFSHSEDSSTLRNDSMFSGPLLASHNVRSKESHVSPANGPMSCLKREYKITTLLMKNVPRRQHIALVLLAKKRPTWQ